MAETQWMHALFLFPYVEQIFSAFCLFVFFCFVF